MATMQTDRGSLSMACRGGLFYRHPVCQGGGVESTAFGWPVEQQIVTVAGFHGNHRRNLYDYGET